jgi:rhamnosyltransferase
LKISVIIPVKNGEATLVKCLGTIKQQLVEDEVEIVVLDSMSTDNSREIAKRFGAKIISVPNGTFNHGLTRNMGVQQSNGELIYFTVQDAYLPEGDQLKRMAAHFNEDKIVSVTGIQGIPNDVDKNPALWFKRFTNPVPEVKYFPQERFEKLTAREKLSNSGWDNVNAMYRKSALEKLPFRKTDFAEDALWAVDALGLGWKIIRDPSLLVYHYHYQAFSYSFKSSYILSYTFWSYFKVIPSFPRVIIPFIENAYTLIKRNQIPFSEKIKWIIHNLFRILANLFSVIIFRLTLLLGGQKLLDKSYRFFCTIIPQGKLKS